MKVGTHFVKEYYKKLSSQPEALRHFYQPSSVLSAGVGSDPAQPNTFELQAKGLKDRFVLEGYEDSPIRFEFENGAIDAQMSVNAGVLLVVTGHIVYLPVGDEEDGEEAAVRRKAFVHTFFLASLVAGSKRSYYVHNDVLRFLQDDEETTVVVSNTTTTPAALSVSVSVEPVVLSVPTTVPVLVVEETVSPGGGVEESKDEVIAEEEEEDEEEEAPPAKEVKKPAEKAKHSKKEKYTKEDKQQAPAKPTSWASMVASTSNGGAPTSSNPSTPTRPTASAMSSPAKAPKTPQPATPPPAVVATTDAPAPAAAVKPTKPEPPPRKGKPQRDPDCTLVIKNFDASSTTEADIRAIFDGFATETETKVVGCTVSSHKALAFVDYDSAKPVLAAVEKHKQEPMHLKGTTLEIYQKTQDYQKPQNRRSQGGRGNVRGGPGGGRQYRRSGSGGRGDRGGGGGRGRGRGGP